LSIWYNAHESYGIQDRDGSTPDALVAEVNKLIQDRGSLAAGFVCRAKKRVSGIMQSFMQPMIREPKKRVGRLTI